MCSCKFLRGYLLTDTGKKKVLLPGFAVFALGTLLLATSQTLSMMYFGNVLAGIGSGTFYGVAFSFTNEYVPKAYRSLATAIVNSGTAIGSGIGMISSSYFISELGMKWQGIEYASFITIIAMLFIFYFFIEKDEQTSNHTASPQNQHVKMTIKTLFQPQLIGAYAVYFATCYAYYLVNTWLPNFLEIERGFEGATIGFATSLIFIFSVPGALFFSRLADKYQHKKVILVVFLELMAAIMLFATVMSSHKTGLLLGLIFYGFFGKVAVEPIIISWLGEQVSSKGLGTTLGVFNFLGMSSSVIAPSLTGIISDQTGSKISAFYLATVILLIGTFGFYMLNRHQKAKSE